MQPPYQPSGNAPAATDTTGLYATTTAATTLPPQTQANIGDRLTAKGVNWAWYAGAWAKASSDRSDRQTSCAPVISTKLAHGTIKASIPALAMMSLTPGE